MVRSLLFSTLYPSAARPLHGLFVETRLRELLRRGGVESRVVAPVPWFGSTNPRFGEYARMAATPRREVRHDIEVHHPRFIRVPKLGMSSAPFMLALGARATLARLRDQGFDFDLIDAHYYYPDGVAAAMLALWFNRPLAVTARGTDVNLIPQYRIPRLLIRWAVRRAQASIGVSAALVERLRSLGAQEERLHVMRNGVDLERFRMLDRGAMRAELGLRGEPLLLTVGNLHEHKGQRLVVRALQVLRQRHPHARLAVVGDGPDRGALQALVAELGLGESVRLVGAVPNTELARWYSAADVMVLASEREGWPNVLLEAMACGTPVVASRVGGVPEIVQRTECGRMVGERTSTQFALAIEEVLEQGSPREAVRAYAEAFSWDRTSTQQLQLFQWLAHGAAGVKMA